MNQQSATPRQAVTQADSHSADQLALTLLRGEQLVEPVIARIRAEIERFERWSPPAAAAGLLLSALAATHPAAIAEEIGGMLADVIRRGDLSRTWQPAVDEAFQLLSLLVATPAHAVIPALAYDLFRVPELHPRWFKGAVDLLRSVLEWHPEAFDLAALLSVAEQRNERERDALFLTIVEPLLLGDPAAIDVELLRRAVALPSDPSLARYLAAGLIDRRSTPDAVRLFARRFVAGAFPLRAVWQRSLGARALQVLCVQNIADGQGDEMIRTVPLLQGLLDAHPDTRVTLVTDRAYLYGHSRIETISFEEPERIAAALSEPIDLLIEFAERRVPHLNHDPRLTQSLAALRAKRRSLVDIQAGKGWNWFTFDAVWLGGLDWAGALQLNRPAHANVYDSAFRLLAELGLPRRVGEPDVQSERVLAGHRWPVADAAWARSVSGNRAQRPVALINPYGGNARLKGFAPRKFADLSRLVESLVDDGYFVLLCPNGTPWGSAAQLDALMARLPADAGAQVGLAPGPAAAHARRPHGDGSQAMSASEVMRCLIGFVACADLVVTVEGWMMHAAFLLGRPYRLLLLPESRGTQWQPWGRSVNQRTWHFVGDPALDHPPLPEYPRKHAWLALLARIADPLWDQYLREIEATEDQDLRVAIIRALGRVGPSGVAPRLVSLLDDPSHRIRGAAAEALLRCHCGAVSARPIPDRDTLEAHRLVGAAPPDWAAITGLGDRARPALERGLHGADPVIRREAAAMLEQLSRERAPATELGR